MIPTTENILIEMHFIEKVYDEVCEFIDSVLIANGLPVTKDDINWIVDRIGDTIYADQLLEQCSLYSALYTKYITAPKEAEKIAMYGIDEPCLLEDINNENFLPNNRESRRHGMNYAKETRYKKPNRRRPWE